MAVPAVFDRRSTLSENGSPARTWSGATISTAGGEAPPAAFQPLEIDDLADCRARSPSVRPGRLPRAATAGFAATATRSSGPARHAPATAARRSTAAAAQPAVQTRAAERIRFARKDMVMSTGPPPLIQAPFDDHEHRGQRGRHNPQRRPGLLQAPRPTPRCRCRRARECRCRQAPLAAAVRCGQARPRRAPVAPMLALDAAVWPSANHFILPRRLPIEPVQAWAINCGNAACKARLLVARSPAITTTRPCGRSIA